MGGNFPDDFILYEGEPTLANVHVALKPDVSYENFAVWDDPQKTVVIKPTFTATAYREPGFYTFYRQECDESCLTQTIIGDNDWLGPSSGDKTFKIDVKSLLDKHNNRELKISKKNLNETIMFFKIKTNNINFC